MPILTSGLTALALAALHLAAGRLLVIDRIPRNRWLSAAGGVSVAYVIVHLLPEVAGVQRAIDEHHAGVLPYLERHAWVLAFLGLVTFYGLQQHAARHRKRGGGDSTSDQIGRIHIASYAVYNALIGYLLHEVAERGVRDVVVFGVAMGLHFMVNDHSLREDHGPLYRRTGRWVLLGAILLGWALGAALPLSEAVVGLPLAFVAGSVLLNVLKEELPEERESRVLPFALAGGAYTVLLLAI